jgi:acetate kinase
VVHGGEYFSNPVIITDEVVSKIEKCVDLAPLHNPANLLVISACKEFFPEIQQIAIFDTAFHQTMEPTHYLYALPTTYYETHKIRRYGFH